MRRAAIASGVLAVGLLLGGCTTAPAARVTVVPSASPTPKAVFFSSGTVTVPGRLAADSATGAGANVCAATPAFRDIRYGARVTVTDRGGATVGSATLDFGGFDAEANTCTFGFSLGRIVANGSAFEVHVGAAGRAPVSLTEEQLSAGAQIRLFG